MRSLLVQAYGITKRYENEIACDEVSLSFEAGKIHGIFGENGAGKTTLMRVLAGLLQPDSGDIYLNKIGYTGLNTKLAKLLGIQMAHQNFSLVNELSVAENFMLAAPTGRLSTHNFLHGGSSNLKALLSIDPSVKVGTLSMAERQQVEIYKCLNLSPSLLILDEPTAYLSVSQREQLFNDLMGLRDAGGSIIIASHEYEELLPILDTASVMKDGRRETRLEGPEISAAALGIQGSLPGLGQLQKTASKTRKHLPSSILLTEDAVLRAADLRIEATSASPSYEGINFELNPSEILAITSEEEGVLDALVDVFLGLRQITEGSILLEGEKINPNQGSELKKAGIGVVLKDRDKAGCIPDMSVAENLFLISPERVAGKKNPFISKKQMRKLAHNLIRQYHITPENPDARLSTLSGGNQQRVLLARELSSSPRVLVMGSILESLDVNAVEDMKWNIQRTAASGSGVLLLSRDSELLGIAHRTLDISVLTHSKEAVQSAEGVKIV